MVAFKWVVGNGLHSSSSLCFIAILIAGKEIIYCHARLQLRSTIPQKLMTLTSKIVLAIWRKQTSWRKISHNHAYRTRSRKLERTSCEGCRDIQYKGQWLDDKVIYMIFVDGVVPFPGE